MNYAIIIILIIFGYILWRYVSTGGFYINKYKRNNDYSSGVESGGDGGGSYVVGNDSSGDCGDGGGDS